jgi:succinate dehydrogenase / fumarate reductase membrane anchor subunit
MTNKNIGPKRLVVGAHYGLRDWLAQRATAVVMAVYTVILLVLFLTGRNFSYEGWQAIFTCQWFRVATFAVILSLLYHAWVGIRDVWMDYVTKNVFVRIVFQVATILWLVACAFYAAQILWRV